MDFELELAMQDAVLDGHVDQARSLCAQNPGLALKPYGQGTWLHAAAQASQVEIVKLLIELGCDVNAEENNGNRLTPLDCATIENNIDVIRVLLDHGANPNQGRQVIGAIAGPIPNSLAVVKLLDQYGANIHRVFRNEQNGRPMNALSTAIAWDKQDVADYLRSKGAVLPHGPVVAHTANADADDVLAHFREHFGPVDSQTLIQIVPTDPPIAVHVIPSSPERNHVTLFTTGVSSRAMTVPDDYPNSDDYRFAELFVQLPADWPYREVSDVKFGWPHRWLQSMGAYPHQHGTWLGGPVAVVVEQEAPEPLAPSVRFDSMLFLAERSFKRKDGNTVQLYRLTPLFPEERELERRDGIAALLQALDRISAPLIVDMNRPSATA